MEKIEFKKTLDTLKDMNLLLSKRDTSNISITDVKSVKDKFNVMVDAMRRGKNEEIRVDFKKLNSYLRNKHTKEVQAMNVAPNTVSTTELQFCIDRNIRTYAFDVLRSETLDARYNQFRKITITDHVVSTPAGVPNRALFRNPIGEAAQKPLYDTVETTQLINVVKLAYQELVTLEAERSYDAATFVLERATTKLFEIVHLYILAALVGTALPVASLPGAGTYPQANIVNGVHWLNELYSRHTSDCRDRLHVFMDPISLAQWKTMFDVGVGYWTAQDTTRLVEYFSNVDVVSHDIRPGLAAPAHPLETGRQMLVIPSDGYYLAMDSDVTIYRDRLPTTNQTYITVEMFVAAAPLPFINAFFINGSTNPISLVNVATLLANI